MKRVLSALMAGALTVAMAVPAFAADSAFGTAYDEDGVSTFDDGADVKIDGGIIKGDPARPNGTYYISLGTSTTAPITLSSVQTSGTITDVQLNELVDTDVFKLKVNKDDGSKYIKKISVVEDKVLGSLTRTSYLKIELNDSTTTSELKATGDIIFTAKDSSANLITAKKVSRAGADWGKDAVITIPYSLWINNKEVKGEDGEADTGDRVYFKPSSNENNTMVWGDDRAALFFEGNDDTSKFYARLSTKSDSEIYSTYGDPVNADLWFYDFVGSATIPSTSRATLTLGIPWDDDDDYTPNPEDCFIYEKDADGNLVDVTSKFTFDADNDGTTGIEGWTIKTRTLGTYVISDTELDTTVADDVDEEPADDTSSAVVDGGKEIPNTGSSDMVGVAVVAAVVSLAAAGAVAFKKASK